MLSPKFQPREDNNGALYNACIKSRGAFHRRTCYQMWLHTVVNQMNRRRHNYTFVTTISFGLFFMQNRFQVI